MVDNSWKKKKSWLLGTSDWQQKMEDANEEDKEKVCAFHLIVRGFSDLVCFGTEISNLGLIRHIKWHKQLSFNIDELKFFFF